MSVKVIFVKKGQIHPPGNGRLLAGRSFESVKKIVEKDYAVFFKFKCKADFLKAVSAGGSRLSDDAAIFTWVEEENEFGPVCP